jgi:hypothetical protein
MPNYVGTELSRAEVEQILAPIALYPNEVLVLILAASTCPDDVTAAARWSQAHPDLTGNDAYRAALEQNWDPAVTSLAAFPQVLQLMNEQIDWTRRLGDTFLAQSQSVAVAIGDLRQRAMASGTFDGAADNIFIFDRSGDIVIGHGFRGYYYIPTCNPSLAYGPWPWPDYSPADSALWIYHYDWAACDWNDGVRVDRRVLHNHALWSKRFDHKHPHPPRMPVAWQRNMPPSRQPLAQRWYTDTRFSNGGIPRALALAPRSQAEFARWGSAQPAPQHFDGHGIVSGAHMGSVTHVNGGTSSSSGHSGGATASTSSGGSSSATTSSSSGASASSSAGSARGH